MRDEDDRQGFWPARVRALGPRDVSYGWTTLNGALEATDR
jgi:hypothetical protein